MPLQATYTLQTLPVVYRQDIEVKDYWVSEKNSDGNFVAQMGWQ